MRQSFNVPLTGKFYGTYLASVFVLFNNEMFNIADVKSPVTWSKRTTISYKK